MNWGFNWKLEFLPEARKELRRLDGSQRQKIVKAIDRTLKNPLPRNKGGVNLTGCLEIIIDVREDEQVYDVAEERITRYGL
ncbi:MAG: hypothetical protein IJQ58_02515 [Synergistaceae bacterium]|nr:hypothetical protein [Synergistaceae bacterium]